MPRSQRLYQRDVGDGLQNAIIVAAVTWISKNFPEAKLLVKKRIGDDWDIQHDHPLVDLIRRPNEFYSGQLMWMATIADWTLSGNAYWIKLRNRSGKVSQLFWTPSTLMKPCGDKDTFISHYEYRPGNQSPIILQREDVVHFRFGLDPTDIRKGYAPLTSLFREVFTDDEASNFTASVLSNMGMPGVIISPARMEGASYQMDMDVESIKEEFSTRFAGDRRGDPMIMSAPTDVKTLSWSPEEMNLRMLRQIPEERICAVIGVNPMVLGLGAGSGSATFKNYAESRDAAYENTIIPAQRIISEELETQLLDDFEGGSGVNLLDFDIEFDLSTVRSMQTDEGIVYERMAKALMTGAVTVSEARKMVNLSVDETHEIYLRNPQTMQAISAKDGITPVEPTPVDAGGNEVTNPVPRGADGRPDGGPKTPPEAPQKPVAPQKGVEPRGRFAWNEKST